MINFRDGNVSIHYDIHSASIMRIAVQQCHRMRIKTHNKLNWDLSLLEGCPFEAGYRIAIRVTIVVRLIVEGLHHSCGIQKEKRTERDKPDKSGQDWKNVSVMHDKDTFFLSRSQLSAINPFLVQYSTSHSQIPGNLRLNIFKSTSLFNWVLWKIGVRCQEILVNIFWYVYFFLAYL